MVKLRRMSFKPAVVAANENRLLSPFLPAKAVTNGQ